MSGIVNELITNYLHGIGIKWNDELVKERELSILPSKVENNPSGDSIKETPQQPSNPSSIQSAGTVVKI
jgi:hypothetical protein